MTPQVLNHGHPSLHQRFLLLPRPDSHALRTLPLTSITPFRIATYPIILWASLALGFTANTSLTLNLTQSQVFAAPPYHFSPSQVGFTNFAMAAGAIIGLLTAGPLSDWVSMRRTRGNGGGEGAGDEVDGDGVLCLCYGGGDGGEFIPCS